MLYPKSKTEKLDSELFMHPTICEATVMGNGCSSPILLKPPVRIRRIAIMRN